MNIAGNTASFYIALIPEPSFSTSLFRATYSWFNDHHLLRDDWEVTLPEDAHMSVCFLGKHSILHLPHIINSVRKCSLEFPQMCMVNAVVEFSALHDPNIIWYRFERNFSFEKLVKSIESALASFSNWKNTPARITYADPYPIPHITLAKGLRKGNIIKPNSRVVIPEYLRDIHFEKIGVYAKKNGEEKYTLAFSTPLGARNIEMPEYLHPTSILGWGGTTQSLARAIADLRFDVLATFLYDLALSIKEDAEKDAKRGRHDLSKRLHEISRSVHVSSEKSSLLFQKVKHKMDKELEVMPEIVE